MFKLFIKLIASFCLILGQEEKRITCAWYHWDPYQYVDENNKVTGLDYALVTAIFANAGYEVDFDEAAKDTWAGNQDSVLTGAIDITSGAFATEYRKKAYHLSDPYRHEWNSLYVKSTDDTLLQIKSLDTLLAYIEKKNISFGVIRNYKYTSNKINRFIERLKEQNKDSVFKIINESNKEEENFEKLVNGETRIIISDRLVGARLIWKNRWGAILTEQSLKLPEKAIHLLIHRDEDPERDKIYRDYLVKFNHSLKKLKNEGKIDDIIRHYLFPVLLNITVQRDWFFLIDIIGAVFFAISGLFIARENRYDLFGVIVMTTLLAGGGGIMRDLFVGRTPAFLNDPIYLYIVLQIGIGGYLLIKIHRFFKKHNLFATESTTEKTKRMNTLRSFVEAVALGAYTIVGVGVAVEMRLTPLGLWGPLLGCLTSCGGGILATALHRSKRPSALNGLLDPEVSIFWGLFFSFYLLWQTDRLNPDEVFLGVLVTITGSTLSLLFIFFRKMKSSCIEIEGN